MITQLYNLLLCAASTEFTLITTSNSITTVMSVCTLIKCTSFRICKDVYNSWPYCWNEQGETCMNCQHVHTSPSCYISDPSLWSAPHPHMSITVSCICVWWNGANNKAEMTKCQMRSVQWHTSKQHSTGTKWHQDHKWLLRIEQLMSWVRSITDSAAIP
jgi:hypothetical protein